jgi:hypothetical protein
MGPLLVFENYIQITVYKICFIIQHSQHGRHICITYSKELNKGPTVFDGMAFVIVFTRIR